MKSLSTDKSVTLSGITNGFELKCDRCGEQFIGKTLRAKYCSDTCRRKRTSKNETRKEARNDNNLEFIGVDGEGVDRPDGKHEYVMLSVGSTTLWDNGKQLQIERILAFLWERYCEKPSGCYVGFFLGYDFIQWERLLPQDAAHSLLTTRGIDARKSQVRGRRNPYPDAVVFADWEIDIMAGRRFKLRPHVHHKSAYNSLCRNRTCRKMMEDEIAHDVIPIDPNELNYKPSDNVVRVWSGSASDFWKTFIPKTHSAGSGNVPQRVSGWLYICDTGPFWQTSFLNVIDPKGWHEPVCTDDEFATVISGKADRGTISDYGRTDYYADMQRYNVLENEILARVTDRLNKGFMNEHIPIKLPKADWYGPGRAAQIWMDSLHARLADPDSIQHNKEHGTRTTVNAKNGERKNEGGLLNADVYMSMPSWFYDATRASYYGGWFEQMVHGHIGNVWEYDINSAYPFVIASLPCLHTTSIHNGAYTRGIGNTGMPEPGQNRYTLLYGTVRGTNAYIGAMPHRTRHGSILRPLETRGWYWQHEIEAAVRAKLIDNMDIEEWASLRACECGTPFDPPDIGITRMYQLRLDHGKNSPQGKALKLVYNSAYGKTAQSIGAPKYSNPFYASLITAGCRTLILNAIATHPYGASAVTMVATDGVYFTSQHPNLMLSKTALGAWDETFKPGMTQLMPGIYWDDNTRERIRDGASPKLKSRGVNAKDLANQIANLDYEFSSAHSSLAYGGAYDWPAIEFKVNFLLDSAKLALQRGKWETAGRVQHGTKRCISSNPVSKREPIAYRDNEFGGITRTRPYGRGESIDTTPYDKSFGFTDNADLQVGRDGDDGLQYFRDLLNH